MEVRERIYYESVYDAAVDNGLLFMEVWKSIRITDHWAVPTFQQFYMNQRMPIRRSKGRTEYPHRPK
jgi:quinol monooxygenase YgiN